MAEDDKRKTVSMDLMDPANLARLLRKGEAMDAVQKALSQPNSSQLVQAQPDGTSLLHNFATLGCYDIVVLLWQRGARPSILKKDNSTLLHSAVRTQEVSEDYQRSEMLKLFLACDEHHRNSLPIDYKSSKGWTALKLAARVGLERCVEVLLDNGAHPSIADDEGFTPLHNAIGNPDIVKLLATKSSNIDLANKDGDTALLMACERGLVPTAVSLLENKADPNIHNKQGITPLIIAARAGQLDLVKALVRRGANTRLPGTSQGVGPLHWAAHKENEAVALFLIDNGADILQKDKEGRTPLSMASPGLAAKMTAAAQKVNPDLSLPEATPTSISAHDKVVAACCSGNVPALQVLLATAGISVDYVGSNGSTLLHMAAYCGQFHVVGFLIHVGANWRAVDREGDTMLHLVCMKETKEGGGGSHDKTLEFLLTSPAGVLKNSQNNHGDTPIMVATRCKLMSRIRLLLRHGADVSLANCKSELPLHKACSSTQTMEALMYFAELTSDLNVQDGDGWTPLMHATKADSAPLVKYLLQRGASPNVCPSSGFTALYLAAQEDHLVICRLLLEGGADPLLAGGAQKLTPLHIAAHRKSQEICQVLVEHGADIHQTNSDGDTPLSLAEAQDLKHNMMAIYRRKLEERERSTTVDNESSTTLTHKEQSVNSEAGEGGGLTRQSTFSKENEREDSEGDTVLQARYQEALQKLSTLKQSLAQTSADLTSTQEDRELLLSRNQSLSQELQRQQALTLARHIDTSLSFSEHQPPGVEGETGHNHPRWLVCKTQYKITTPVLNTEEAVDKFFDVHRGTYRGLPVAVKVVRGVATWGAELYQTFYQEINVIRQLQCPWLVQFIGCRVDPDSRQCVVITELMGRGSLHSVLHQDRLLLEWTQRLSIMRDVCRAMVFLHSHDTLHRNLVPRNILIGEHLNAKVGGFGLWETQNAASDSGPLPNEAPQVYMAPEAIEKLEFTQAADVYSFGIVMCEVATGDRPFSELSPSDDKPFMLAIKVYMGRRPRFSEGVSDLYQRLAERCWGAEPKDRPSFETVLSELTQKLN